MNDRVPDLLVEQLALGELPPEQARRVQQQLEADDDPRLAQLRASDAEILAAHPPAVVARRIRDRFEREQAEPEAGRSAWWFVAAGVAVAAAAALAWWIAGTVPVAPERDEAEGERIASLPPQPDTTRLKGDPVLLLHRKLASGTEQLAPADVVAPGDELLVSYESGDAPHGVIVSLDGAGEVTLHFPADASRSTALRHRGEIVLHTFELDDAPAFERFFFVTADAPIDVARVVDAARALARGPDPQTADLEAGEGLHVVDFPLVRRP